MAKKVENLDLQSTLDQLEKLYGKGTVLKLDSSDKEEYDAISTGSIGFDYITLGIGGVLRGKLYELMGWEGSGKSTICGHIAANFQRAGHKVLYIDGEHALDKNYFSELGVDISEMLIAQPSTGEEGFTIATSVIKTGEIGLVIIDSDSSLLPKAVIEGEVGDSAIGKKAKMNNDAYPKIKSLAHKHNTCVIVVSQFREKIGVMFGNPTTTQGGHALKFYSDCRIEVTKSLERDSSEVVSNITRVKTVKNKMSAPYRQAEFNINYGEGIDHVRELIDLMHLYEIGKKYGTTFTVDDNKVKITDLPEMFEENPDLYIDWRKRLIQAIKNDD